MNLFGISSEMCLPQRNDRRAMGRVERRRFLLPLAAIQSDKRLGLIDRDRGIHSTASACPR